MPDINVVVGLDHQQTLRGHFPIEFGSGDTEYVAKHSGVINHAFANNRIHSNVPFLWGENKTRWRMRTGYYEP
jgi:hypothetical protein